MWYHRIITSWLTGTEPTPNQNDFGREPHKFEVIPPTRKYDLTQPEDDDDNWGEEVVDDEQDLNPEIFKNEPLQTRQPLQQQLLNGEQYDPFDENPDYSGQYTDREYAILKLKDDYDLKVIYPLYINDEKMQQYIEPNILANALHRAKGRSGLQDNSISDLYYKIRSTIDLFGEFTRYTVKSDNLTNLLKSQELLPSDSHQKKLFIDYYLMHLDQYIPSSVFEHWEQIPDELKTTNLSAYEMGVAAEQPENFMKAHEKLQQYTQWKKMAIEQFAKNPRLINDIDLDVVDSQIKDLYLKHKETKGVRGIDSDIEKTLKILFSNPGEGKTVYEMLSAKEIIELNNKNQDYDKYNVERLSNMFHDQPDALAKIIKMYANGDIGMESIKSLVERNSHPSTEKNYAYYMAKYLPTNKNAIMRAFSACDGYLFNLIVRGEHNPKIFDRTYMWGSTQIYKQYFEIKKYIDPITQKNLFDETWYAVAGAVPSLQKRELSITPDPDVDKMINFYSQAKKSGIKNPEDIYSKMSGTDIAKLQNFSEEDINSILLFKKNEALTNNFKSDTDNISNIFGVAELSKSPEKMNEINATIPREYFNIGLSEMELNLLRNELQEVLEDAQLDVLPKIFNIYYKGSKNPQQFLKLACIICRDPTLLYTPAKTILGTADFFANNDIEIKYTEDLTRMLCIFNTNQVIAWIKLLGNGEKQQKGDIIHTACQILPPIENKRSIGFMGDYILKWWPIAERIDIGQAIHNWEDITEYFKNKVPSESLKNTILNISPKELDQLRNVDAKLALYQRLDEEPENLPFARECAKWDYDTTDYLEALGVYKEGLEVPLPKWTNVYYQLNIPVLQNAGTPKERIVNIPKYRGYFLSRKDPRGLMLGEYTGCCQHMGGVGEDAAIYGQASPKGAFFVVEDISSEYLKGEEPEIIAQSLVWESQDGTGICFDNVEGIGLSTNQARQEDVLQVYRKIAGRIQGLSEGQIQDFAIGTDYGKLNLAENFGVFPPFIEPERDLDYSDAQEQQARLVPSSKKYNHMIYSQKIKHPLWCNSYR